MKKISIFLLMALLSFCLLNINLININAIDETNKFNKVNHVSLDNTNIIGGLSTIRYINSIDELNSIKNLEYMPTTCLFKINNVLEIVFDKSESLSILDVLTKLNGKTIPGFYVENEALLLALTDFLKENDFYDCFIVSKDSSLIKKSKDILPGVSYCLDLSDNQSINNSEIRKTTHLCGANVIILNIDNINHEKIQELYDLGINTWVELNNNSTKEIYEGIVSGAIGVITDETDTLTSIVKNEFNENTITRLPLNIAHTGMPRICPENTIEGARLAYKGGADIIELDIQLTTDNKLAIMHDTTTYRTCNENLVVEESTMEELKELYVNKGSGGSRFSTCRIPELEEYFVEFKDTDMKFFVEIKSDKLEIVTVLKEYIEKYDMYDRVTVISINQNQVLKALELMPDINVCLIQGAQTLSDDFENDLVEIKKTIGSYYSTLNPNYQGLTTESVLYANTRAISIYPWTYSIEREYTSAILSGYKGITGNRADTIKNMPKSINVSYDLKDIYVDDSIEINLEIKTYDETIINYNSNEFKVRLIDNNTENYIENNKIIFKEKGEVNFVVTFSYDLNGNTIDYYSDVFTVNVLSNEIETKTKEITTNITKAQGNDKENNNGCNSSIHSLIYPIFIFAIVGITIKKKEYNRQ